MNENSKKVLLIMFSILFTLFLGEILLQVTYRIKENHWLLKNAAFRVNYIVSTDDRRQYTLRPNYSDSEYDIHINQWGERKTPQDEKLENNRNIIVCLGDSVPFSAATSGWPTYPAYLAQNLTNEGFKYYVINAGVPSYNLRQSFDRLELGVFKHVGVENVKVITVQAGNDIALLAYYRENWTPELTWADVRFNIHPIPFSNHLAISHYLSQLISQPKGNNKNYVGELMAEKINLILQEELVKLQKLSDDVIVILLPINPFYYQLANTDRNIELERWDYNYSYVENYDQLTRDFNDVLSDISSNFDNVFFLDVRIAMDNLDRNDYYSDYIHLNPEGNKLQAQLIFDFLAEKNLIQKF